MLPYLVGAVLGGALVWAALSLSGSTALSRTRPRPDPATTPPARYEWAQHPQPAFPIPPYARHLEGVLVVLDPGHVGQRDPGGDWKRGPTGLREAEVNLRVAQFLREFLAAAGAEVLLTRERDECLDLPDGEDLRQRADFANRARADLLLSIHHNGSSNPDANYTSLFYHRSPEHSLAGVSAAHFLLTGLNDALRLDSTLECAVLDDRALYDQGLAVLREARVPAVLSEASFHSNPAEEARLRDPVYNRREAYGMFLGLARWTQAGLPRVRLVVPQDGQARAGSSVTVALDDGLASRGGWDAERTKVLPKSIVVRLDGQTLHHRFDEQKQEIRITLPRRLRGQRCTLWVDFANVFGQHVLHPRIELHVAPR